LLRFFNRRVIAKPAAPRPIIIMVLGSGFAMRAAMGAALNDNVLAEEPELLDDPVDDSLAVDSTNDAGGVELDDTNPVSMFVLPPPPPPLKQPDNRILDNKVTIEKYCVRETTMVHLLACASRCGRARFKLLIQRLGIDLVKTSYRVTGSELPGSFVRCLFGRTL
jgi:hypothetical protein